MAFYWMNAAEENVIEIYLQNAAQNAHLYLGLFTAPIEANWDETKVYADLTEVVAETAGYGRETLEPADWTKVLSVATQPFKTFNFASGITALGYFIIDTASGTGKVLAVEYFAAPIVLLPGEYLKVQCKIEVQ